MSDDRKTPDTPRLDPKDAAIAASFTLALHNLGQMVFVPRPDTSLTTRILHHFYDIGHLLTLGCTTALFIHLISRTAPKQRNIHLPALTATALIAAPTTLAPDFTGFAQTLSKYAPLATLRWLLPMAAALSLPIAAILGTLANRPYLRWIALSLACMATLSNFIALRNDYLGIHLYLTAAALTLAVTAFAGAPLPRRLLKPSHPKRRTLYAIAAAWAALSLIVWPSNTVILQLFFLETQIATPWLARARAAFLGWNTPVDPASFDPETLTKPYFPNTAPQTAGYFRERPPSLPPRPINNTFKLFPNPVVILITIDSARAEVFQGDKYKELFPNLFQLRDTGLQFTQARSPGAQTYSVLTSIFTGKYFSQQRWAPHKNGKSKRWPHQDTSPGFPAMLTNAGILSKHLATEDVLMSDYGCARGFGEEIHIGNTPPASAVIDKAIETLKARRHTGNLFLYMHLLDAHAPYDRAGTEGTPFERYLRELALIDTEIGRLKNAVHALGLRRRTAWIISADHGEAFGEHDTYRHALTLYDELTHVPLFFIAPGIPPNLIEIPVSLIDLGPTILNLFGMLAPGDSMGESLLPFIQNPRHTPARPIFMDSGRLIQALLFPDGFKLIRNKRRGTLELYDIQNDPGELNNLSDSRPEDTQQRHQILHTFFGTHTLREDGYTPPYMR